MTKILHIPTGEFLVFVNPNSNCFSTIYYDENAFTWPASTYIDKCVEYQITVNCLNNNIPKPFTAAEFEIVYD